MAFVVYDDIKNLIPAGLEAEFRKPDVFEYLETEAGKKVTEITAIASPADINDRPTWVIQPMAYIMTKLLTPKMTLSENFIKMVYLNYKEAIDFLNTKRIKGAVSEISWSANVTLDNLSEI